METQVLDHPSEFDAADLLESFRSANKHSNYSWAAKCLEHLGSATTAGKVKMSDLLRHCSPDWQAALVDLLFEDYGTSSLAFSDFGLRHLEWQRWVALAKKFKATMSARKRAADSAQSATNAKRPAENATGSPQNKARKTGSGDPQR